MLRVRRASIRKAGRCRKLLPSAAGMERSSEYAESADRQRQGGRPETRRGCGLAGSEYGGGNGHVEVVIGEIRSDAVVTDASGDLLVEIRVSHLVDEPKATKVRAMNARMIEIDLSTCPVDLMMDAVVFAEWIRFAAPRHWIWEPSAARRWERSRDELEARLSLPVGTAPRTSGMLSPVSAERWEEIRQQFEENEWIPIGRPPVVDDPLIGCWVWLDRKGEAEIVQRLTRAGGVYRVRLSWGEFRIVYLGRPG